MSWEENVRKVVPYTPGEQPNKAHMIKLNTNECPYPPAPGVTEALAGLKPEDFRLYPDPNADSLVSVLAEYYGLEKENVFVGVGSDDVLALAFQTFFNSDRPIVFPQITYSFYDVWADLYKIPYEKKPLAADFHIRKEDYMGANGGVIFPNPNAPTGLLEDLSVIEEIVQANPDVVVIVDEAYIDFGGESALPLIKKYDNLLVVQTFSKSRAMAGMRIGYAMAQPELIKYLNDVKYSFNSYTLNSLTIEMGTAAILDEAYFKETTQKIIATRERTKEELRALGYRMDDSKSNFLFVTHDTISMEKLFEDLKKKDIYVRHFSKPERIANYLRITIGTDEEMNTLIMFLKNYKQS